MENINAQANNQVKTQESIQEPIINNKIEPIINNQINNQLEYNVTQSLKTTNELIEKKIVNFWADICDNWDSIYKSLINGVYADHVRVLNLFNYLIGDLIKRIDIEITIGELNRLNFKEAAKIVEVYISPKLLIDNVFIVELFYSKGIATLPTNMQLFKYRSYNIKMPIINQIEYDLHTFAYSDFGCQHFEGVNEEKKSIINIVLFVKRESADKLLTKKEVTFVLPDKTEQKLIKWIPTKSNIIDILLVNIIGEYNLVHRTGYIEFLPEGDPLIQNNSVFTELSDLREVYKILDKKEQSFNNNQKYSICATCMRRWYQGNMFVCTRCKNEFYCGKICQIIHFHTHKKICKNVQNN